MTNRPSNEAMRRSCHFSLALIVVLLVCTRTSSTAENAKLIRVLLVTGRDVPAHDWRATTAVTRTALEKSKKFEVVVSEEPAVLESSALSNYDVLVVNHRNRPTEQISALARENVESFVRGGKGFVALHFAVNAWESWDGYRKMIGRHWVRRRAGKKVSGHGPKGPFRTQVVHRNHPITEGLEDFDCDDELYAKLQGSDPIDVLVDAYSDWSHRREPLAWTTSFGAGRSFVLTLGHGPKEREVEGYQHLLVRGCEWAASGKVLPVVE